MKKKLLLIFFIVLIVIFLIIFFFKKDDNINEEVNNTINKSNEYKISLTLKNIYYINNKKMNSKIVYTEIKKDKLYKIINKLYENNTLIKEDISYINNNNFYYKKQGKYKIKKIKDASDIKPFNINYSDFFNNIKKMSFIKEKDGKKFYRTKMKSTDAFSLIYKNSFNNNLDEYTNITIISNKSEIEEIKFNVKDKSNNIYYVDLKLDFGLQDIKLDIN